MTTKSNGSFDDVDPSEVLSGESRDEIIASTKKLVGPLRLLGEQEALDAALLLIARLLAPGPVTKVEAAREMALLHGAMASALQRASEVVRSPEEAAKFRQSQRTALEEQREFAALAAKGRPAD